MRSCGYSMVSAISPIPTVLASQVAEWCAKWPNQPKMRFVFEARLKMGTPTVKVYIGRKDGSWLRIEGSKHVVLCGFRHGEWGFEAPNMGDISRWMIWPFRQLVSSGSVWWHARCFFICSPCQDLHGTSARGSWGMVTNILVTMERSTILNG